MNRDGVPVPYFCEGELSRSMLAATTIRVFTLRTFLRAAAFLTAKAATRAILLTSCVTFVYICRRDARLCSLGSLELT